MATRIRWNMKAFAELRTEPGVLKDVTARAQRIADASGDGYEVDSGITGGRIRARASVRTHTPEAVLDNARNNTLIRSLDAGR